MREAVRLYEQARKMRRDPPYQAFIDMNVAQCLRRQGYSAEAVLQAQRGLDRLRMVPDTEQLQAQLTVTEASALADINRHEEAVSRLERARALFATLMDNLGEQQAEISLRRSLVALGRTAEAQGRLKRLLTEPLASEGVQSQVLGNLALLLANEAPDQAQELFHRNLLVNTEDQYDRVVTLIIYALFQSEHEARDEAIVLLRSALAAATQVGADDLSARARLLLGALESGPT